ncbi:protein TolQ [SCandidatus Aminicenantes bacterium Aminicenantia_JdfR_composite]|jgi:biopolymer transport protein TolQ|nr:protein TolQ [SCandidatus Aminicenantes bacterium Aminicenantia_JdfR_composite]MCP2597956.1 protein TolQ [Candidatus Aminicenantes bacterium AC-335-L06]
MFNFLFLLQPKVSGEGTILSLILRAGLIVKLVLLILLFFSIFSWAVIIYKSRQIKKAKAQTQQFLRIFRRSRQLSEINEISSRFKFTPLSSIFKAGYQELNAQLKLNPEEARGIGKLNIESLNRVLLRASNQEISKLEAMMSFLATTGSVTPFIGLFGTVWGIMDAFHKIGLTKSASLAVVAPGIAEALIATAAGLFAAIPAVIFYNHYLQKIKDLITDMDDFSLEFINLTERLYGIQNR